MCCKRQAHMQQSELLPFKAIQGHQFLYQSKCTIHISILVVWSVATWILSCTVSEIRRLKCRKSTISLRYSWGFTGYRASNESNDVENCHVYRAMHFSASKHSLKSFLFSGYWRTERSRGVYDSALYKCTFTYLLTCTYLQARSCDRMSSVCLSFRPSIRWWIVIT